MELSVSPDLTVYLAGRAAACLAARLVAASRAAVAPRFEAAGVAAEWRAGACAASALAAGALVRAKAAATPASAGAARIGIRRRLRGRAEFAGQPKGLLPEKVALTGRAPARCADGAKCGTLRSAGHHGSVDELVTI